MIIDKFEGKVFDLLRNEINSALETVRAKYGLKKLKMTNISYTQDGLSFHTKVEAEVDSTVSPEAAAALKMKNERVSMLLGFNKNIIGESFMSGRDEFTVVELKTDRPKYPIIANKKGSNSMYKFQATKNINWLNKEISYKYDF